MLCHEIILAIECQGLDIVGRGLICCVMTSYRRSNIRGLISLISGARYRWSGPDMACHAVILTI